VLFCEWYNSVLHDDRGKLISVLSLVLDVTARQSAEDERTAALLREQDARRHAEEADRLKDEFLATLSHELRTPLTSILGWASMIRNGEVEGSNATRAIETIERNARSQARLIDDLLDVSRIITGNLRLDLHPLNLAPIVNAALDALRPTADVKGIRLQTRFEPSECLVKGDPNRLRQVIWNLLSNAIKFTQRGGSVNIDLKCIESTARLRVSDTGDGISAEFLPYVFDRFRQAEGSISRKQGGLGLGLAVARHLVELHGGAITAESGGLGKGSVFTVDLPLTQERRDPARAEERRREVDRRRSRKGVVRLDGVHVLLVEDDDDSRKLLSTMLRRYGARVTATKSAAEALEVFEGELPDVMISDIGMPDQDGYELIRKLRTLPVEKGGATPAIALTGYASRKDRERALGSGYQQHMAKPIEQVDMISAIAALIGRGD
jgi:signal transduction histidine kinase/CheY-like chemotaxis protein